MIDITLWNNDLLYFYATNSKPGRMGKAMRDFWDIGNFVNISKIGQNLSRQKEIKQLWNSDFSFISSHFNNNHWLLEPCWHSFMGYFAAQMFDFIFMLFLLFIKKSHNIRMILQNPIADIHLSYLQNHPFLKDFCRTFISCCPDVCFHFSGTSLV